MSRPMPKAQRLALVEQERGRRRALAQAAHAHISFYEHHDGFDIDYSQWTEAQAMRYAQGPYYDEHLEVVRCLCEEAVLGQFLWRMISNEDAE